MIQISSEVVEEEVHLVEVEVVGAFEAVIVVGAEAVEDTGVVEEEEEEVDIILTIK